MATLGERLAASLSLLERLQKEGRHVFRSGEFTRVHRERLVRNGFLREVMKGWLISSRPESDSGDTTFWYASFWEFCGAYCTSRFHQDWCLSPDQSLLLHAENTVIPQQVIIHTPKGTNNSVHLLFGTSLYDLTQKRMPPAADITEHEGLRLFAPEAALTRVPESFFARHPVEAQVVLSEIRDATTFLARLLAGGHPPIAARRAGDFRRVGRADVADEIVRTMKIAGYDLRESVPFNTAHSFGSLGRRSAPVVGRLQAMWERSREPVINAFPRPPGLPGDPQAYLRHVDEIYGSDAYHSLSIEGYRVTPQMIERVRTGNWDPDNRESDRQNRDALAARGYWQAFRLVRETVAEIIAGGDPGSLVQGVHSDWYRELFQPSVAVGLIPASALAGYRNDAVYLRGSRHVPPRWQAVRDAMPTLFELLKQETEPAVRAVLGHWLFGYIHPYPDGNGRMARFVMNAMLASGGYPWTVIRLEDRNAYLSALEAASVDQEIGVFARFMAERVQGSQEQNNRPDQC
ncbi:MAG: Fic family protein [Gammaproteobacteria bacterium]|nr:Fic family protein [Gammaproteobacteria bacterium]